MKVFAAVALFAFVAVQLTLAAPAPEDEKKAEVAAVPAAPVEPAAGAASPVPVVADVKSAVVNSSPAPVEGAKPAEEKKA